MFYDSRNIYSVMALWEGTEQGELEHCLVNIDFAQETHSTAVIVYCCFNCIHSVYQVLDQYGHFSIRLIA